MPQRINGCGTWYYGKKNVVQYQGACRSCRRVGPLTSYDTRLWVCLVLVPVIPLRKYRIIEQCSACTRHMVMPFDEWERAQTRAQEAIAAYGRSPGNPQLAREALELCAGQRNVPAFLDLAPKIERNLSRDGKSLSLVAAVYEMFGRPADAERVLRAAINVQDDADTREALADNLLRQGRPEEAEPYLQHIVDQGIPDRVELLFSLAQGYQLQGDHDKALAVFDQCEAVNPPVAQDDSFGRLRAASEQNRGTRNVVKPNEVLKKARRSKSFRKFAMVAPMLAALIALAYFGLAWLEGTRQAVYLVNGLERPYTVLINGTPYNLPAQSFSKLRVHEGDLKLAIQDAPAAVAPEVVSIHTSLLTRPLFGPVFVINPDQAAVLLRARVFYAPQGRSAATPHRSYFGGRTFYAFTGVDYPFETPPQSISMDANSTAQVSKDTLTVLGREVNASPAIVIYSLADTLGKPAAAHLAERHVLLEPEKSEYMGILDDLATPDELAAFIRPTLTERPIRLAWHRLYQNAMSAANKGKEVDREYRAMLAQAPNDKTLAYLAARAAIEPDRFLELSHQATTGEAPCPWAFFSLCRYYLGAAQTHDAATNGLRAIELMPENKEFRYWAERALVADGQYEKAMPLLTMDAGAPFPECAAAISEQAYVYTLQKKQADAQLLCMGLRPRLDAMEPTTADQLVQRLESSVDYCSGSISHFLEAMAKSPDADDRLAAHLTSNNVSGAEADLRQIKKPTSQQHLLLYIAATRQNRTDVARPQLQAAIELLATGHYEERAFASALGGKSETPLGDLLRTRVDAAEKRVLLTALALAHPSARQPCFELARKLNYDKRYPHLLLQCVLSQGQ